MLLLMLLILQLYLHAHARDLCQRDKYRNCLQGSCTRTSTGRTECAEGCVRGFWGTGCRIPCPEHCEMCDRYDGTCLICSGDLYGDYCNNTCDTICHGFHCNKDGTCSNSTCQNGWYGPTCSNQCNQTFLRCGKTDGQCLACKDGFYGMNCELGCNEYGLADIQMQQTCLPGCTNDTLTDHEIVGVENYFICTGKTLNCLNHNCTRTQSGKTICAAGCVEGFWGTSCRIPCPENCQTCEHLVEKCTTCKKNQYGLFCNLTCQEQCHGFHCNQTGTCSDTVCTDGRYGDDCNSLCNQRYKTCHRRTGHCIKCKETYYGEFCELKCPHCDFKTNGKSGCEHGCNKVPCPGLPKPEGIFVQVIPTVESCISTIQHWMSSNMLMLNDDKTEALFIGPPSRLKKCDTKQLHFDVMMYAFLATLLLMLTGIVVILFVLMRSKRVAQKAKVKYTSVRKTTTVLEVQAIYTQDSVTITE